MLCFLLVFVLIVLIYYKFIKPCGYWKRRGIKYAKSWPLVGNMGKVFFKKKAYVDVAVDLYNEFPEERYVGYMQFQQYCLLIRDVDLIKKISVKDFDHFTDHYFFGQGSDADPFINKSLVSLRGQQWKNMRCTLSPVFTSSKMKNMYHLIEECAENFVNHFDEEVELEMRELFAKFATNVIASTAFGVKIDCLNESDNEFYKMGKKLQEFSFWQTLKLILCQTSPKIGNILKIEIFPHSVTKFFRSVVKENIEKREKEEIVRPDLIHLLMEARKGQLKAEKSKEEKKEGFATTEDTDIDASSQEVELTDDHIVAQAMFFFFAGLDTVSTTASFLAYELALNPDIQKKLQKEIDSVKRSFTHKVSYEVLLSMKYLDQVISETLRLWPAGFETDRVCVKDYVIQPKTDDDKIFIVKKGTVVIFPIMAVQRDGQYYSEPTRFDPERFSDENKSKVVPGTYMPFGLGPRNCIGSRFALLEIKTLFYHLLSKFDVVPIARTEIPIRLSRKHFNMQPEKGFWLGLKPRKKNESN